ncbi:MAG TPA: chemotaxis protein CheW [Longimicrobiales bacterium]
MDEHLVFQTEGERFGLPAQLVEEVIDAPAVRHLAGMPSHVAGVLKHRGHWLPAIDAAPRFGLSARGPRQAALVIRRGRTRFALTADTVLGIRPLELTRDMGVVITDLGLVTPVDPALLFRADLNPDEEITVMPEANSTVSLVVFTMAGEQFGTDISNVVEVLEHRDTVHVPRAPDFVDGVVQVRDFVLPIIDLRKRMELPRSAPTLDTRIIVVLMDDERIGLLVDSVIEVAHIRADLLSDPPAFFRGVAAEYLQGMATIDERLVIVLRLDRILSSQERIELLRAELSTSEFDVQELVSAGDAPKKRGRRNMR